MVGNISCNELYLPQNDISRSLVFETRDLLIVIFLLLSSHDWRPVVSLLPRGETCDAVSLDSCRAAR